MDRVIREDLAEKVTFNRDLNVEKEIAVLQRAGKGQGKCVPGRRS